MRRLLPLAFASLAACATTENYERMLSSWVGAPEVDLVRRWGAPVSVYDSGTSRFIVYSSSRNVYVPGVAPSYSTTFAGNTAYTRPVGGVAPMNIGMYCQTTFEIVDGRVVSWRWQGNDCKANPPN